MQSKTPFALILVGTILGYFFSVVCILYGFVLKFVFLPSMTMLYSDVFAGMPEIMVINGTGVNTTNITMAFPEPAIYNQMATQSMAVMYNFLFWFILLLGLIGLIFSVVISRLLARTNREPKHADFTAIAILGGLGIFFGMSIGGILALIGGILGSHYLDAEQKITPKPKKQ